MLFCLNCVSVTRPEPSMPPPEMSITVVAAFLVAGLVKGIAGAGLPSVAMGLMGMAVDLKVALALLLVPSFVTNVWQALGGVALVAIVKRTWPMMIAICVGTWLGVGLLARSSASLLAVVLGATLVGYALMGLVKVRLPAPGRHERLISLPIGVAHGVLAGMTGSFIPAVPFLQAIGLAKDQLVQAMGIVFTVSTIALAAAMSDQRLLSTELLATSAGAVLPALLGMYAGQRVRRYLSEEAFKRVLFIALMIIGAHFAWKGLVG